MYSTEHKTVDQPVRGKELVVHDFKPISCSRRVGNIIRTFSFIILFDWRCSELSSQKLQLNKSINDNNNNGV